jgi:hypothetical protein
MRLEELINLHRYWGYSIQKVGDSYFHHHGFRKSSFPLNYQITVDQNLVNKLKWSALISSVLVDMPRKNLYDLMLTTDHYDLDSFTCKVRNRIRKSLEHCKFRRPALEDLLTRGLEMNRQTMKRQSRSERILTDQKLWKKCITSIYNNPGFIILGAYFENVLTGFLVAFEMEGRYNLHMAIIDRTDSSRTNPMSGLLYTMVNNLIQKQGTVTVSYGIHEYVGASDLNRFKRNMRFEPVPVTKAYVINPLFLGLVRMMIGAILKLRKWGIKKIPGAWRLIHCYQGYRILQRELERVQEPEQQPEPGRVQWTPSFQAGS